MSFFADFTYEGSRSIIVQYLGLLGAGALTISMVTGFGELAGYGLRLFDRFGELAGYGLRLFDRFGMRLLVPLTVVAGIYAPLAFLGGFWTSFAGERVRGPAVVRRHHGTHQHLKRCPELRAGRAAPALERLRSFGRCGPWPLERGGPDASRSGTDARVGALWRRRDDPGPR